jgi:hypothetical protein
MSNSDGMEVHWHPIVVVLIVLMACATYAERISLNKKRESRLSSVTATN